MRFGGEVVDKDRFAQRYQIAGAVFVWGPLSSVWGLMGRERVSTGVVARRGAQAARGAAGPGQAHGQGNKGQLAKNKITPSGLAC